LGDVDAPSGGNLSGLDHCDTAVLKGLAILAIVFHNFFHLISPVRQNEFVFHPGLFAVFLQTVRQPSLAIQAFFSFFGHFGVAVFIFLSAYGLTKSHWDDTATWRQFMAGRIRKLFPIVGVVVLPWMVVTAVQTGLQPFMRSVVPQIVSMLTGLTPLVPGLELPPVGPWWFIPFILEFYAMFFLLRRATQRFGWLALMGLTVLGLGLAAVADPFLAAWKINLFMTPLGRMPSACLGVAAALYPFRLRAPVVVAAAGVLVLGSQYAMVWPFTFGAALVLSLSAYMPLRRMLRKSWILERVGRYSLLIFLINGIVRDQFLRFATTPSRQLLFGGINAVACIALAALIQDLLLPAFFTGGERRACPAALAGVDG
jgi:peptidoglycan/LPS O-acetylase OafA/YrhL